MNRRIRSIFWLMTLCIIGINAFQGYWLWTTYRIDSQRFNSTMRDALFSVLQHRQIAEAGRLFAKQGSKGAQKQARMIIRQFDGNTDREQIQVFVRGHEVSSNPRDTLSPSVQAETIEESCLGPPQNPPLGAPGAPAVASADTLARRISNLILLDWAEGNRINLANLSMAYGAELRQRGINARFKLDTVSVPPRKPSDNVLIDRLEIRPNQADLSNVLNTLFVPINPVRNLYARVSFETPTVYLLRRMGWLLGSSLLLLLLTTGCFLFMLSTILRQKKLSEVKNDFINNMTHELKTPIATVTAAVEALQHFGALNDPQKTQTYLTISQKNLQRLSDLVEKVLTLAVEEKKELVLSPEWVKPSELINQILTNYQLKADKPVDFEVVVEPADDGLVLIDRFHVTNAINNLIDNAIKYSNKSVHIQLSSSKHEGVWRLSVKDNGIGIPKAYQSAIFDRFFRVPTGNLHPVKGFGLGLSYVKQVIEKHGGLVEINSEPGVGSEFILLIPEQSGTGQAGIRKLRLNLNPFHTSSTA